MSVDYDELKNAIRSERELMEFMTRLDARKWDDLMKLSREMSQMRQAEAAAARAKAVGEANQKKAEMDAETKKRQLEAAARNAELEREFRKRQEKEKQEFLRQQAKEHEEAARRAEKEKEAADKRLVDYQMAKDVEAEKERARIRLEVEEQVNEMTKKRLAMQADAEYEKEKRLLPLRAKLDHERFEKTKEWDLKRSKELQAESAQQQIELMRARWQEAAAFFGGAEGRERLTSALLLGSGLIGSFFVGKAVYPIVKRGLKDYFFRPALLSKSLPPASKTIFSKELEKKLQTITQATSKRASGHFFGGLLLFGPSGTGKTLFARQLAQESGMKFAMLSGPAFDQFSTKDAVVEIKSLFKWANRERGGVLLFVDEAESFLQARDRVAPERSKVLNEWISQTGTETKQFMTVYATNRPEILDPAVISRITRAVHIAPPSSAQLEALIHQKFAQMLPGVSYNDIPVPELAQTMCRWAFVGRDVLNLSIALQQYVAVSQQQSLTRDMVDEALEEIRLKKELLRKIETGQKISVADLKQ